MIALSYPQSGNTAIIKFGTSRSGTPRCPAPCALYVRYHSKSQEMKPQKIGAISPPRVRPRKNGTKRR